MTAPPSPQAGPALAVAAALLLAAVPLGVALAVAGRTRPAPAAMTSVVREMLVSAVCGAALFFTIGSWLMLGADWRGLAGLPPGAAASVAQAGAGGLPAVLSFYHFGLALVPFWLFYAALGRRLTPAGNALVCALTCGLAFPIAGHWAWGWRWLGPPGAGWLAARGFTDFAGGAMALGFGAAMVVAGLLGGKEPSSADSQEQGQDDFKTGWGLALAAWIAAAALAAGASGGGAYDLPDALAALAAQSLAGAAGALAAKAASLAALAGPMAGLEWLAALVAPKRRTYLASGSLSGPETALGLAAGVAASACGLGAAPWWTAPALGAVAGLLAWPVQEKLGSLLDLDHPVRLALALGLGGAVGAFGTGLLAGPQPSLTAPGLLVSPGFDLAVIDLAGAAAIAAWAMAVVWLAQRALRRVERAIAALPEE